MPAMTGLHAAGENGGQHGEEPGPDLFGSFAGARRRASVLFAPGLIVVGMAASAVMAPAVISAGERRQIVNPFATAAPDPADLAEGGNRFGFELESTLAGDLAPGQNLFFSPYSIRAVLAMTYAGARHGTAEEMAQVLHFDLPPADLPSAFGRLGRQIHDGGESAKSRSLVLRVANAIWVQEGLKLEHPFLDAVQGSYQGAVTPLDFGRSPEGARQTINRWIEERTNSRIKDLLAPGLLSSATRLVLTNAIYFKGDWKEPFSKALTQDEPFHLRPGQDKPVPTMHRTGSLGYYDGGSFDLVTIPYAGERLECVLLVPREIDGSPDVERRLRLGELETWLDAARVRKVDLFLPRFRASGGFSLRQVLESMGMVHAFTPEADLGGITGTEPLQISEVVHKAWVEVDEKGTEAAAATGVMVKRIMAMAPEEPVLVRADRPYVFLIRDRESRAVLFIGRIADPAADSASSR